MIKKCKQCVLDTTVPEIQFDQEGICNFFKNYILNFKNFIPYQKKIVIRIKEQNFKS